jgi:peptide/nickel transport system permease protein
MCGSTRASVSIEDAAMNFQPVVLWSDILLWGLFVLCLVGAGIARRDPLLRAAWRRVGQRATGAGSAVILAFFVVIGLADSLHYRPQLPDSQPGGEIKVAYSVEVFSLLDAVLSPLHSKAEKTYSEPLATRSFAKEMVERPDGSQSSEFPRLRHGGKHLADEAEQGGDVVRRIVLGALAGVLFTVLMTGLVLWYEARSPQRDSLRLSHRDSLRSPHRGSLRSSQRDSLWLQKKSLNAAWQHLRQGRGALHWPAVLLVSGGLAISCGIVIALAGGYHVLGTDKVGQDVLYHVLKSVRTALVIGLITTLVTLPIGIGLGVAAGYFRGWIDDLIQYLYTTLNSIPSVLLIAAAALMMQTILDLHPEWFSTAAERADMRLLALCFILGMTSWTGIARLLRAETLKLSQLEYVQAARAFGVPRARILRRHIIPNVMHIVIIALVMDFSGLVLAEAVLSYVGIGVDPSMISFGTMINNARMELSREPVVWWSLVGAFVAMFVLVLAANLLADVVRDAFDPRQAESGR